MAAITSSHTALDSVQPEAKRRKVRKGTHSCWECKRRKMKCILDPLSDTSICNGCRRRGSQCVSQEFSENASLNQNNKRDRFVSDEALQVDSSGTAYDGRTSMASENGGVDHGISTPMSMNSEHSQYLVFYKSLEYGTGRNGIHQSSISTPGKYERLSQLLHSSLPSREDTEIICKPSILTHELLTMPYSTLHQNGLQTAESLLEIPDPSLHPVLISRYMLQLATLIQILHPDAHETEGLSESPRNIMERIVDLAINLVTSNEELVGSIEGLECVMIESVYQANAGNLRRAWLASRRAMVIGQLMGLDRSNRAQYEVLDTRTKYHPSQMWFRIVFIDRFLCLLLGLPQGCLDRSMASDAMLANDTPMGRLERIHCVIASRLLERNESNPRRYDIALMRTLDVELQKAARNLPSKWWLAPNPATTSVDSKALFWDMRRLLAQIFHYNLLNQLHLPHMLCSSSTERNYEYSRITCVNASREILSRFITIRSFNQVAYCCRTVDFLALMAAMTLLLAHLNSHQVEGENLLAHQYLSDRAMIEKAQEHMKEVNRINSDALSAQSADLLRRLLTLEDDTLDYSQDAKRVSVQEPGRTSTQGEVTETTQLEQNDDGAVSVHIPYFGIIKIAREGMSKIPKRKSTTMANGPTLQLMDKSSIIGKETPNTEPQRNPSELAISSGIPNIGLIASGNATYDHLKVPITTTQVSDHPEETNIQPDTFAISATGAIDATNLVPPHQNGLSSPLQYEQYPGLVAGAEDWAFQGVDMAFFDTLMSGVDNGGSEDVEWTTVAEGTSIK